MMALWCSNAQAREWSQEEIVLEMVGVGLIAVDLGTTHRLIRDGYVENNPLLGRTPSTGKIAGYFLVVSATHIYLVDRFPEWGPYLQWGLIMAQGAQLADNRQTVRLNGGFKF